MDIGNIAVRGVVGPLFVGHGTQKLFGWFGGHGLEGTAGFFEGLGLRPGRRAAIAAGVSEALGGALLTLGALTPLAATMVSSSMITAMRKVHLKNGPWVTEGGYEYNLVVVASMAHLVQQGPGRPSVDDRRFPNLRGTGWAVASIGAALAGSFLVDVMSEPMPEGTPTSSSAGDPASTTPDEARFTREDATSPLPPAS
jgi:putative oxidoreductase